MHSLYRCLVFPFHIFYLTFDNLSRLTTCLSVTKKKVMSKFILELATHTKRVNNHLIVCIKLHKIHTSECRRILVLLTSSHLQILTLNLISQLCDIILTKRQFQPLRKSSHDSHHKSRRRAKPRTCRCIHMQCDTERKWRMSKIRHYPIVSSSSQNEETFGGQFFRRLTNLKFIAIWSDKFHLAIIKRFDSSICVHIYGRVENSSSIKI